MNRQQVHKKTEETLSVVSRISPLLRENDRLTVYDFVLKPSEKAAMQPHPEYVMYAITHSRLRLTSADGKTDDVEFEAGRASFRVAQAHVVENIGRKVTHALFVQLKT
jgi:hypothetical protein